MKALDLFCGAGGVAVGLMRAGYHVTGVDILPQPWYPGNAFVQGNALDLASLGIRLADYDLIWASPPCQAWCTSRTATAVRHAPNLIPATRKMLSGYPRAIIENIPLSPVRPDLILTWQMFRADAPIPRRRFFELSFPAPLTPPPHRRKLAMICAVGQGATRSVRERRNAMGLPMQTPIEDLRRAFGADWIPADAPILATRRALNSMIPPCYAEFIASAP